jgi:hypothetical protein
LRYSNFVAISLRFPRALHRYSVQQTDDYRTIRMPKTRIENAPFIRGPEETFVECGFPEGFDAVCNLLKSRVQK